MLPVAGCVFGGHSTPVSSQEPSAPPASGVAIVLAASLNVRAGPSLDGPVIGSVQRGDTLCVIAREPDWLQIRVPQLLTTATAQSPAAPALTGYAARGFLSEQRIPAEELRSVGCRP